MKDFYLVFISMLLLVSCRDPKPVKPTEEPYTPTPVVLEVPYLFPKMDIPVDNPLTQEGIFLGRKLFYEPLLSGDGTQSCASCHVQNTAFTDPEKFSTGIDGLLGTRNAMPLINVGWMNMLFWDGRASGLEDQAIFPVEDPLEMHADWKNVVEKLKNHSDYPELFRKAFKTSGVTKERVTKALAQFERTLISKNSKTDDVAVIGGGVFYTDLEQEGFDLFNSERGDCFHCHSGILFTDNLFHNNGLDENHDADKGLFRVTNNVADIGKFKTPTLRNVAFTAPYMHDGRFETLDEVLQFYGEGVKVSSTLDPLMSHQGGINMTSHEQKAIKAYLLTLSDTTFLNNPDFSDPN